MAVKRPFWVLRFLAGGLIVKVSTYTAQLIEAHACLYKALRLLADSVELERLHNQLWIEI